MKVVFVVGPTASGKSSWALEQAERYSGSIVNVDSVQCYRDLEVGAATPSREDQSRVPHFLYSYVAPPDAITAGKYVNDFYQLVERRPTELRFPLFLVGGTGFYVQALEKGLYDVPPLDKEIRLQIEQELIAEGAEKLYIELIEKDPTTKVHQNDHYRLVRALEIIRSTGKIPSQLKEQQNYKRNLFPFPILKLGFSFEKEESYGRVVLRTKHMIENGLIEETQRLLNRGHVHWPPLSSVGYKETVEYLNCGHSPEWLNQAIVTSTMKLIKKQKTWFKRDLNTHWQQHDLRLNDFLGVN